MQALLELEQPSAFKALSDPNRLQVLKLLMSRRETITSLGVLLDKHPAWVRHHVKTLEAAGLVVLVEEKTTRNYTEKYYRACASAVVVRMLLRPEVEGRRPVVAMASSDFALELLAEELADDTGLITGVSGSLDSLIGVRQGLADIAGCHLLDTDSGQYNVPYARHLFPDRDVVVVTLAHREQGLIVAAGNPLALEGPADLSERHARFVNRNRGSGTRLWLDQYLSHQGIVPTSIDGFNREVSTHSAAAALVAAGQADAALGIRAAADRADLGFVPLFTERYDLVIPNEVYGTEEVTRLLDRLHGRKFRHDVDCLSGYDSRATGDEYKVAV